MAAPWTIEENVSLSRSAAFTIYARREQGSNYTQEEICGTSFNNYAMRGVAGGVTIDILRAGGHVLNDVLVRATLGWSLTGTGLDPDRPFCPALAQAFDNDGFWNLAVTCSGAYWKGTSSQSFTDNPVVKASGYYGYKHGGDYHSPNEGGLGEAVTFSASAQITVNVAGTFTKVGRCDYVMGAQGDYRDWLQDHDVYGQKSLMHEVYYVPQGNVTISVSSPAGSKQWTVNATTFGSQSAFEAYFKYGFGGVTVTAFGPSMVTEPTYLMVNQELCVEGSVSGNGATGGSASSDTQSYPNHQTSTYNPTSGVYTVTDRGDWVQSPAIAVFRGPFDVTYSAGGGDFDASSRTASVETIERHGTAAQMQVSLGLSNTFHSAGFWRHFGGTAMGGLFTSPYYGHETVDFYPAGINLNSTAIGVSYHGAYGGYGPVKNAGLMNLTALGEPEWEPVPPSIPWYDDARVEVYSPFSAFYWANALQFDIANECIPAVFNSTSGWLVTAGTAAFSMSGTNLRIDVFANNTEVRSAVYATNVLIGARRAKLNSTSNDTGTITIGMGGKTWTLDGTTNLIDLLNPIGTETNSTAQVHDTPPDWSWGVHALGTLSLAGLRNAKYYTLTNLVGTRLAVDEGGFTEVQVFSEGFIGGTVGDGQADDDPWTSGRRLHLYVDGVCAGIGLGSEPFGGTAWLSPGTGGLVGLIYNESTGWKTRTEVGSAYYMTPGIYTGYGQVNVPIQLKAARISLPLCGDVPTLTLKKLIRGQANVEVVDTEGTMTARNFSVDRRYTSGGTVVETYLLRTNAAGWKRTASLQQPIAIHGNTYTVKIQDKYGNWVQAEPVETRNRYGSRVVIRAPLPPPFTGESDFYIDAVTGAGIRADVLDGDVVTERTLDWGLTFANPVPISTTGTTSAPCVFLNQNAARRYWGLGWNYGTTIQLAETDHDFASFNQSLWATNVKNIRTCIDPNTGIMVAAAFDNVNSKLVSRVSLDWGANWTAWGNVVATATEQVFGLSGDATTWAITALDADGDPIVYWSLDGGFTWQVAA